MNDSTLPTSPAWPTRWPKNSFAPWWTIGFVLLLAAITVSVLLVAFLAAAIWLSASHPQALLAAAKNPATMSGTAFTALVAAQLVGEAAGVLIILLALPPLTRFTLPELGFRFPGGRVLGFALLGAIGMVVAADGGGDLVDVLAHSKHQQLVVQIFEHMRHDSRLVISFAIFAVLLQPIAEETIFRVFLFNLGLRYGGFWGGAIFSGVLFGLAHGDLYAFVPLTLGGIVLAWVYYRSRNAYASMISHALFNALSTAALYFAPKLAGS